MITIEPSIVKNETRKYAGNFKAVPKQKRSKFSTYLESLYSYPPKIKLKWDTLDEFNNELLLDSNYGVLEHSFPFINFMEDWFFNSLSQNGSKKKYSVSEYIEGYLNKNYSTTFYKKGTKPIQEALKTVPVFVILNGNREIVLTKPSKDWEKTNLQNVFQKKIYDICGSFDSNVEKRQNIGLFFLSQLDAEIYLKALAQSDIDGTETVGLSIHCIGLNSAYKIMREYHPGIDLRIVPDLTEVQNCLSKDSPNHKQKKLSKQLRFHPSTAKVFKGTPIYIVQILKEPKDSLIKKSFINPLSSVFFSLNQTLDSIVCKSSIGDFHPSQSCYTNSLGLTGSACCISESEYRRAKALTEIGVWDPDNVKFKKSIIKLASSYYEQNDEPWEESVNSGGPLTSEEKKRARKMMEFANELNVAFFSDKDAKNFMKKFPLDRLRGGYSLKKNPKLYIYNLEDFIESWEETLNNPEVISKLTPIHNAEKTIFIPSESTRKEILTFKDSYTEKPLENILKALDLKFRVLKRNFNVFLSVD